MGVSVSHLSKIGYLPSFWPKSSKPCPKLLEDEESWTKLVDTVAEYRIQCRAKNKGKGTVPAFTIHIVDTGNAAVQGVEKGKKVSLLLISVIF